MTTAAQWIAGARIRTLPAAVSPVAGGTGVAIFAHGFQPVVAVLALIVSVALQVGVNYANDYSDGIRGTDADRVGPMRLVGSGAAEPAAVKRAAFGCFAVACLAGLAIVIISQLWWLIAVGIACVLAAWFYTGGKHPYGYLGLGEVFVFVFFGLVAVCGTVLAQASAGAPHVWHGRLPIAAVPAAVAIGALTCVILVANNVRDLTGDAASGKRTLATRMGDRGSRWFFAGLHLLAVVGFVVTAALTSWWALLALAYLVIGIPSTATVLRGATGHELIGVLKRTGTGELIAAAGLIIGLVVARLIS